MWKWLSLRNQQHSGKAQLLVQPIEDETGLSEQPVEKNKEELEMSREYSGYANRVAYRNYGQGRYIPRYF
jgi:hypothetical protein